MTTLDRSSDALLVIDVQNQVVADSTNRDSVVANITTMVERARAAGVAIVWVQHEDDGLVRDTPGWELIPELVPRHDEPTIHKQHGDSFEGTDLEDVLAKIDVGKLFVVGAQTDACVRSTMHGAFARGYNVTLVSDAHTTEDLTAYGAPPPELVIAHTNLYWQFQTAPGRSGEVLATAEVSW